LASQLLKIPVDQPNEIVTVVIDDDRFAGMDGIFPVMKI